MRNIFAIRRLVVLTTAAAATLLVSCFRDEIVSTPFIPVEGDEITFGLATQHTSESDITRGGAPFFSREGNTVLKSEDGAMTLPMGRYVLDGIHTSAEQGETRGSVISKNDITSFMAWAMLNKSTALGGGTMAYFSGVTYTKDANSIFNGSEDYLWPGDGTLDFVAVAPVDSGMTAVVGDGDLVTGFSYTTPEDATLQKDIVLATAPGVSGSLNASVPLKFKHIMTAVNIKIGSVSNGTIESITLKGVYNKGTYNIAAGRWYPDKSSTADYKVKFAGGGDSFVVENTPTGTSVNASDATFMFIPQEQGDGAVLEVVFNNGQKRETLTGSIAGDMWDMGRTTNYNLSIDENLKMIITLVGKKLDAHYIIGEVQVTVEGFEDNDTWRLTAIDGAGREVTVQPKSEANPLALQGFWTDKVVDANGNETSESARGAQTYTGKGNVKDMEFFLFIPENITGGDIAIDLKLSSEKNANVTNTKTVLQKCPTWVDGGFGWETVDDDESGKYGFKWTRKVAYLYPYSKLITRKLVDYCTEFIQTYGADANGFATVGTAGSLLTNWDPNGVSMGYRAYILLDYSTLNSVTGANSVTEGYNNTLALYRASGTTATSQFETILNTTLKADPGNGAPELFRLPSEYDISLGIPAETGQSNDLSAIMEYIQKKNKYYVYKKSHSDGEGFELISYIPYFKEEDLKWYLPARDQFQMFVPNPDVEGDAAANYWSSTTAGTTTAYTGGGEEKDRDLEYQVIAVRRNENGVTPATVVIDNSYMAGGNNGDENTWLE